MVPAGLEKFFFPQFPQYSSKRFYLCAVLHADYEYHSYISIGLSFAYEQSILSLISL